MFLDWLYDQIDVNNNTSRFAKLVWTDRNNGCMPLIKSPMDIYDHIVSYHPKVAAIVRIELSDAYEEYLKTLPVN